MDPTVFSHSSTRGLNTMAVPIVNAQTLFVLNHGVQQRPMQVTGIFLVFHTVTGTFAPIPAQKPKAHTQVHVFL